MSDTAAGVEVTEAEEGAEKEAVPGSVLEEEFPAEESIAADEPPPGEDEPSPADTAAEGSEEGKEEKDA